MPRPPKFAPAAALSALILVISPIAAESALWRVPGQLATIQAAIDAAAAGDTILVAAGTYSGAGFLNVQWSAKDLVLKSEIGAALTVLDGGGDYYYHCSPPYATPGFHLAGGLTRASRIEGLTFRRYVRQPAGGAIWCENASPVVAGCVFDRNYACQYGGAIALYASSPSFVGCTFDSNAAPDDNFDGPGGEGGAIYCDAGSAPTLDSCTFADNWAGFPSLYFSFGLGGAVRGVGPLTITRCAFNHNTAYVDGAAVNLGAPGGVFGDCTFHRNIGWYTGAVRVPGAAFERCTFDSNMVEMPRSPGGAAIYSAGGASQVKNCRFGSNSCQAQGGALCVGPNSTVDSCLFAANRTGGGQYDYGTAALLAVGAPITLSHSTIWGSASESGGAAVSAQNSGAGSLMLVDCIIAGSRSGCMAAKCLSGGSFLLSCCDLFGNLGGDWTTACIAAQDSVNGNISADPAFCDTTQGNFWLAAGSPCLAACGVMGLFGHGCGGPESDVSTPGAASGAGGLRLDPITPNPARGWCRLSYELPASVAAGAPAIEVFDALGRHVRTLSQGSQAPGAHTLTWDGRSDAGRAVASGIYFVELRLGAERRLDRVALVR